MTRFWLRVACFFGLHDWWDSRFIEPEYLWSNSRRFQKRICHRCRKTQERGWDMGWGTWV